MNKNNIRFNFVCNLLDHLSRMSFVLFKTGFFKTFKN